MRPRHPRSPIITLSLAVVVLAAWWLPGASEALQLERTAIVQGESWRPFTAHLTHWTTSHLVWDLAAFALLGTIIERRSCRLLASTLITSAAAIAAAVWWFEPGLATYRGLSGVDSALFSAVVIAMATESIARRSWGMTLASGAACLGFIAKTCVELGSAAPLFVAPDASFEPVPLAHLVGALSGVASALSCAAWPKDHSSRAKAAQVVAACPWGSPTGRFRSM